MGTMVHFRQSGGFAGLARSCTVEVEALPPALATVVRRLAADGLATPPPASAVRDDRHYSLTIETAQESRRFDLAASTLPDHLGPLIAHLASLSKR
jgi:hypothetical protein